MKQKPEQLIQDLIKKTKSNLEKANHFLGMDIEVLNYKSSKEKWSSLECFEHLNRYGAFYIPLMRKKIENAPNKTNTNFKSGWLGNYFAESMLPKDGMKKMKTFKSKNPLNSNLTRSVINIFVEQQKEMLLLLERSMVKDLNNNRIKTTLSPLIKLKLGDTFRFVIHHNIRHICQAESVISK